MESRFKRLGLVVPAKVKEWEAEVIEASTSGIAVSSGRQRHERASSSNCCFESRDREWLRKSQLVGSEGLVARS